MSVGPGWVGIDQTSTQPYQPIGMIVLEVQWHQIMTGEKMLFTSRYVGNFWSRERRKGTISQPMYVNSLETPYPYLFQIRSSFIDGRKIHQ